MPKEPEAHAVTPEMMEAGIRALCQGTKRFRGVQLGRTLVATVYQAMEAARHDPKKLPPTPPPKTIGSKDVYYIYVRYP